MAKVYKVLLPEIIWYRHRKSLPGFKFSILAYMKRYPQYEVIKIEGGFIVCHLKGKLI